MSKQTKKHGMWANYERNGRSGSSSHSARGLQRRAPDIMGVVDSYPQGQNEEIRRTVAKMSFEAERVAGS
jgi:hypothetical protein